MVIHMRRGLVGLGRLVWVLAALAGGQRDRGGWASLFKIGITLEWNTEDFANIYCNGRFRWYEALKSAYGEIRGALAQAPNRPKQRHHYPTG